MAIHTKPTGTGRGRYARRATRTHISHRRLRHPGRVIAAVIGTVVVIVAALIWGSVLDRRSEAIRDREAARDWILDEGIAPPLLTDVPAVRAMTIFPEENIGPILIAGEHGGILLPLAASDGTLYFASAVAAEAGLLPSVDGDAVAGDAPMSTGLSLADEVERIARRDLRVILTYTVTYPTITDAPRRTYRRGLELALLAEYAAAGADELLLVGLPCGEEAADRETVTFVEELRGMLAADPQPPAVGISLPLTALATDPSAEDASSVANTEALTDADRFSSSEPLYVGHITPGRLSQVCDFLALDLRGETAVSLEERLSQLSYAYVRYSLRLLLPQDDSVTEVALRHGFDRLLETGGEDALTAAP